MSTNSRSLAKSVAYSPIARKAARALIDRRYSLKEDDGRFSKLIHSSLLERVASPSLSQNLVYGKLIIRGWDDYLGQDFVLTQDDHVIYGNRIERPQRGYPLEYRNFVLDVSKLDSLALSLPLDWKLQTNSGRWITPQQRAYDQKYDIHPHGRFWYSIRGNIENPRRIVVTFPGFGPSTTRIPYAISYLQFLQSDFLKDTVVIAFQDRYLSGGSYMCIDDAGKDLLDDLRMLLASFLRRWNISPRNMTIFGASKGGSIALLAAKDVPEARIITVVPQLDLNYYFTKPFFIHNLGHYSQYSQIDSPGDLLFKYAAEGREIHHLVSFDDELSNALVGSFCNAGEHLYRYRFSCEHGQVARRAIPLIHTLICRPELVTHPTDIPSRLMDIRVADNTESHRFGVHLRTDASHKPQKNSLLFAYFKEEGHRLFQELTSTVNGSAAYTSPDQLLDPMLDPVHGEISFVSVNTSAAFSWQSESAQVPLPDRSSAEKMYCASPIAKLSIGDTFYIAQRDLLFKAQLISFSSLVRNVEHFDMKVLVGKDLLSDFSTSQSTVTLKVDDFNSLLLSCFRQFWSYFGTKTATLEIVSRIHSREIHWNSFNDPDAEIIFNGALELFNEN